jgi:hypothetical protein
MAALAREMTGDKVADAEAVYHGRYNKLIGKDE